MPSDDMPPFCFQVTADLLDNGPLFDSAEHAVRIGVVTEIHAFLASIGFDAGARLRKVGELAHDIEGVCRRTDGAAFMLSSDGERVWLHLGDDSKLADMEHRASAAGRSVMGVIPQRVRDYIHKGNRYAAVH